VTTAPISPAPPLASPFSFTFTKGEVNAAPKDAVDLLWRWGKAEWQRFAPDIEGLPLSSTFSFFIIPPPPQTSFK
jgi:hypothetical protein